MVTRIYNANMQKHAIQKKKIENTAVLAATNFFTPGITPSKTPCKLRIYIAMSSQGKLDLFRNGLATGERLNDDVNLVANTPAKLMVDIGRGDTNINLQYSVGATIRECIVYELPVGSEET